jgi:predicted alpha/beta-fold hydrolase
MKDLINYFSTVKNNFFNQIISIQNKGINDTPLSHPKPYNLASFSDTKEVIDHIISMHNDCELYLIGISLGSLLISQMLIVYPNIENIKAFVSISNPFDLRLSYNNFTYLTDKFLTSVLKMRIINQPILEAKINKETVLKLNSVIEFEEEFTKKVHPEVTDTNEYFEKFSISSRLPELKYYSLFINAEDDKISPVTEICNSQCKHNSVYLYHYFYLYIFKYK